LANLFPPEEHPDLIVGLDSPDDAAVMLVRDHRALVVTTDFFPPVVDRPYDYGAVAAANAMSDVFAMGGEVILALNVSVFPGRLPLDVCAEIIEGGAAKVAEAGGVLAGGHTVTGDEPMYGLAVVGRVDPDRMLRKAGAMPGDMLVLTKPLGAGLVTTALKRGVASDEHVRIATESMATLNRSAARAAVAVEARAATDVTGFGLLGHAVEMAQQSGVSLRVFASDLPLLPGARDYAAEGCVPGGTGHNIEGFERHVTGTRDLDSLWPSVLHDPQTSGGLLIAAPTSATDAMLEHLRRDGAGAWVIGEVIDPTDGVPMVHVMP
jgi:selenide,water dikinase